MTRMMTCKLGRTAAVLAALVVTAPMAWAEDGESTCTYTYSSWSACQSNGTQIRTVLSKSPEGCSGSPVVTRSCTYVPPSTTCTSFTYSGWGSCQSNNTPTRTQSCTYVPGSTPSGTAFKVFGNNDLGMHCVDSSYAVFSILPPYNVVDAQVVALQSTGRPIVLNQAQVDVRYSAIADATGSVNSTSPGKSDFWPYGPALYGLSFAQGVALQGRR